MSELGPWALAELAGPAEFRSDLRFAPAEITEPAPQIPVEPEDPLALAWQEGFTAGMAEAQALAAAEAEALAAAREGLELNFVRLDKHMAEALRQRLHDTVAALCESALAPLALDGDALGRRIERAVALLQRAGDQRTIRLHPDDVALVSDRCRADWTFVPDASLARGALRIETADGGVEDGPAQWRQAIAEALE